MRGHVVETATGLERCADLARARHVLRVSCHSRDFEPRRIRARV